MSDGTALQFLYHISHSHLYLFAIAVLTHVHHGQILVFCRTSFLFGPVQVMALPDVQVLQLLCSQWRQSEVRVDLGA